MAKLILTPTEYRVLRALYRRRWVTADAIERLLRFEVSHIDIMAALYSLRVYGVVTRRKRVTGEHEYRIRMKEAR